MRSTKYISLDTAQPKTFEQRFNEGQDTKNGLSGRAKINTENIILKKRINYSDETQFGEHIFGGVTYED
ncbi:hypothetical protein KCM76_22990 [Zooshikella marina]|uniref:hypothetical protein n=1 Tax=Zooshikella ganghwensis TaxID=202772 RepID=UPI001BAEFAD1|nr:hypothetical protein [Zooshikella ganghwensis]MBU2708879.1 hypothetical protein [Zooshikella ganghwensis]